MSGGSTNGELLKELRQLVSKAKLPGSAAQQLTLAALLDQRSLLSQLGQKLSDLNEHLDAHLAGADERATALKTAVEDIKTLRTNDRRWLAILALLTTVGTIVIIALRAG